jgi:uncharacterized protein YbcI
MSERGAADSAAQDLTNGIVGLFRERFGRGPVQAKCYLEDDHVLVLLRQVETDLEHTLTEQGREDLVGELRHVVEGAFHDELCALVAAATGRRVRAMLSDHDPATDSTALVFLLER